MLSVVRLTSTNGNMIAVMADAITVVLEIASHTNVYIIGRSEPFTVRETENEILAAMIEVMADDDDDDDDSVFGSSSFIPDGDDE